MASVEQCEQYIRKFFREHVPNNGGVEVNCFWTNAENDGMYAGEYDGPMTKALENLTTIETISAGGMFLYNAFKLK